MSPNDTDAAPEASVHDVNESEMADEHSTAYGDAMAGTTLAPLVFRYLRGKRQSGEFTKHTAASAYSVLSDLTKRFVPRCS